MSTLLLLLPPPPPPPPPLAPTVAIVGFVFLLRTNHLTRSRDATESSTDECPFEPPPCWITLLRCSFVLSCMVSVRTASRWKGKKRGRISPRYSQVTQCPAVGRAPRVREKSGSIDDTSMHKAQSA